MWTVIYICNTRQHADNIKKILTKEGFLVKVEPISKGNAEGTCEILVPSAEAEECYLVLFDHGF
ncbi:MAG TPA: hypothetical protein VFC70_04645 [Oscillospiraceae bacterium]|nr:hypothetical protein [Oscillospiraceae bacterium]